MQLKVESSLGGTEVVVLGIDVGVKVRASGERE